MKETSPLYRPILAGSWKMIFKNKSLWFFGLFAALLGVGGELELLSRLSRRMVEDTSVIGSFIQGFSTVITVVSASGGNFWGNVWNNLIHQPLFFLFVFLLYLLIIAVALFFLWLAVASEIGLIKNISLNNKNKKTNLNEGIHAGISSFWPVLGVNILLKLAFFLIFAGLGWAIIASVNIGSWAIMAYYLVFVAVAVVVLSLSFLSRYQICCMVLKKQSFIEAFKSAWQLFKANWLISLEMGAILLLVYVVAATLSFIALIFCIALPIAANMFGLSPMMVGVAEILALAVIIAEFLWINSVITAFQWSAWVMLFEQLDGKGGVSSLIRTSDAVANYFSEKR